MVKVTSLLILQRSEREMSADIKAGDVVRLKSGGPKMTVSKVEQRNGAMRVDCDWFEGTKATYGTFPASSLDVVAEMEASRPAVRTGTPWS